MNMYGGVKVQPHTLTSALDRGGQLHAPGKEPAVPTEQETGEAPEPVCT